MALGNKLRALRERADMTREVLAVRSGISVSTLLRLENDRTANPRIALLEAVAAQLGTTAADLLAGDSKPEPEAATA